MDDFRITLLSDGSSDQVLLPILIWLLRRHRVARAIQSDWADLRRLRHPPERLPQKIEVSLELYPCDLLFIHRDAERVPFAERKKEILEALSELSSRTLPVVCVVPVRMQESWLLFQEAALRWAAGNPNGQQQLALPRIADLEQVLDPKQTLYELLREASGLHGRRLRKLHVQTVARRVVEFIEDFSPLLALPAFDALDQDVKSIVLANGWSKAKADR